MANDPHKTLKQSWSTNADAWVEAVRHGTIESRERVTNGAILAAVMAQRPGRVLDLGCGEGWLVRALARQGVAVLGVDGSRELIAAAQGAGAGEFRFCHYETLAGQPGQVPGPFDVIVANFALLQEDLAPLLRTLAHSLAPQGVLIIQTVHPDGVERPQEQGWREEDFRNFPGHWQPMPWYYRTLSGWRQLLCNSGYRVEAVQAPVHPDNQRALSLILTARLSPLSPG